MMRTMFLPWQAPASTILVDAAMLLLIWLKKSPAASDPAGCAAVVSTPSHDCSLVVVARMQSAP